MDENTPASIMPATLAAISKEGQASTALAAATPKGSPEINLAILDTGVNLNHRELEGKIGKRFDFVDIEGLDTSDFVVKIKGLDDVPEDEVGTKSLIVFHFLQVNLLISHVGNAQRTGYQARGLHAFRTEFQATYTGKVFAELD